MGAGHASTSIGYAVGLKEAMRKGIGEDGKVVAVIGDGALTGGVAFEALHNAGGLQTPIVIVLNDNGMSISPNVGAIARSFQRLRANPRLYHAREEVESRLTQAAARPRPADRAARARDQGGDQGLRRAGAVLRGARPRVHGAVRRPRRRRPARAPGGGAGRRPAGGRPHPHRQGQGLRAGRGRAGSRGWRSGTRRSRARSSTGKPAPKKAPPKPPLTRAEMSEGARPEEAEKPPPQYTAVFGDALVVEAKRDQRVIGITAAMAGGTGLTALERRAARSSTTTSGSPSRTRSCSPPGSRSRGRSRSARSTRPSSSAPTTRSSTTSACRSSTWSSRWTAPGSSATTARPTTAPSTSPTSARCRTWS